MKEQIRCSDLQETLIQVNQQPATNYNLEIHYELKMKNALFLNYLYSGGSDVETVITHFVLDLFWISYPPHEFKSLFDIIYCNLISISSQISSTERKTIGKRGAGFWSVRGSDFYDSNGNKV